MDPRKVVRSASEGGVLTLSATAGMEGGFLTAAEALLQHAGFILRGGFRPAEEDAVPPLPDGRPVRTVIMVGNAGPAMWHAFRGRGAGATLDEWTKRELTAAASALGVTPLFPFDGPPYLPFQRWARRAEPVHSSPIGVLIHPDYGLWHAYRGAFALAEEVPLPPRDDRPSPCEACPDRPCLTTCPVGAFAPGHYDVAVCASHLAGPDGQDCLGLGCRARRACPLGRPYEPDQARFHMRAFLAAHS